VLGQYEAFTVAGPGRLLLVAPNIVAAERHLDVEPRDFRLWVCLHEETHRVQFGAVPWLTDHFTSQIDEFLAGVELTNAEALRRFGAIAAAVFQVLRGASGASIIDAAQTDAQRAVFERMTAFMSLLEGHADYVMDAVGPEVVPSLDQIRARFDDRRQNRVGRRIAASADGDGRQTQAIHRWAALRGGGRRSGRDRRLQPGVDQPGDAAHHRGDRRPRRVGPTRRDMTTVPRVGPRLHRLRRMVQECVADVPDPLLVACSGGPDSLALAAAAAATGRPVGAIIVNAINQFARVAASC
jgi:hypothetical protein